MYTALSVIFLVVGVSLIGLLAYMVFAKKAIIKNGSLIYAVPVFLLVYFMYVTGMVYSETELGFYSLFSLISKSLEIFAMSLDYELLRPLAEDYPIFDAALIVACVLSFITVVFGVVVLFGKRISNKYRKHKVFVSEGDIIIGYSKDGVEYLKQNKNSAMWAEKIDGAVYKELIGKGYTVHKAPLSSEKVLKSLKCGEHHLIAFRDAGYSYSELIAFFENIKSAKDRRLYLHLEATADEMSIVQKKYVSEVSAASNSFVTSFCRYELMARTFVAKHPISKYIPRDFFNSNLTLKDDKEINVVLLGFGKVNCELFKLMATQFQFAKNDESGLKSAPVHYYVFENDAKQLNNDALIKIRNEYDEIFALSDLPAADKICDVPEVAPMDVNSADAKKRLKSLVTDNSYTYFIVSVADDFTNATYAHGIKERLGEASNYKIFVRAKKNDNRLLNKGEDHIIYFGEDADMYSHECIVNNDLMELSQNVNDLYNDLSKSQIDKYREWQRLPVIEQYSNISAALSIYFKLNLLGFDLKKGACGGLDKKTYEARYPDAFMGSRGDDYNYFFGNSTANVLAFSEHSRWNAQYLLSGYKPLSFNGFEWLEKNRTTDGVEQSVYALSHKNTEARRHACLTTYVGLDTLIKHKYNILCQEEQKGERRVVGADMNSLAEIYRYDYMVTDAMYEALVRLGYCIIDNAK